MSMPSPGFIKWAQVNHGLDAKTFVKNYQDTAANMARQGVDISKIPEAQLAVHMNTAAKQPGLVKREDGGPVAPGQAAIVGDQQGNPNAAPEVVVNPPGNAPVQVVPNQQAQPTPDTSGIDLQTLLKQYGPDQIKAAYAQLQNLDKSQAGGKAISNIMAGLASAFQGPEAIADNNKYWQTQHENNVANTVGQQQNIQGSLDQGVKTAAGLQGINQKSQEFPVDLGLKANQLTLSGISTELQKKLADPNSPESQQVIQALQQAGIKIPQGISGIDAQNMLAASASGNDIVNKRIQALAQSTTAGAAASQAQTAAGKLGVEQQALSGSAPGTYMVSGEGITPSPGVTTQQHDFASRVSEAQQQVPTLEASFQKYGQALKSSQDPNVSWGKVNPVNAIGNAAHTGNTYGLQQQFDALKTEGLGALANAAGASALRVAGVDQAAMAMVPTTKESQIVAQNKILTRMDQNIRMQAVTNDLATYSKGKPGATGADFSPDYTGKMAVWNPTTGAHSLIDKKNYGTFYKNGFRDVSDGVKGFTTPPRSQQ